MSRLYIVPTPVGNLEDITFRALRVLREVHVIYAEDTRTTGNLLKHFDISTRTRSFHKFNEHHLAGKIAADIQAGMPVALVSDAGTPGISDPGFLLVRSCLENGAEVETLPGPTAFVPALVNSGLPSDRFAFEGFLPQKKGRKKKITSLADMDQTMIFYESPYRIVKALTQFAETFGDDRKASVSREISKLHEETIRGSLAELIEHFTVNEPRGEFVICIGGKGQAING